MLKLRIFLNRIYHSTLLPEMHVNNVCPLAVISWKKQNPLLRKRMWVL